MDKYRLYDKIIKTKACTYFKAELQSARQPVVIKKLNKVTSWEQILKDKDMAIMKNSKLKNFPNINQIVKDQDQFYIVLENLYKNLQFVIKSDIDKQAIFQIGRTLVQLAVNLSEKKVYPREIRPSHLFIDEAMTIIKLGHLQTIARDITKLDLVQLQDLRYLSPQQVLTSKQIDERSIIFNIGLIICDLIMGKSLITASTKMQYIFEMTRLFPDERLGNIEGSEHDIKNLTNSSINNNNSGVIKHQASGLAKSAVNEDCFDRIIRKYNFSNQFIALLKQMLKIDKSQRLSSMQLLDAWDVVVENQKNYAKNLQVVNHEAHLENKPNAVQYPINDQIDIEIEFQFEQKPTLSSYQPLKALSGPLPPEKNVEDDVGQPIIIKKSKANENVSKHKLNTTKDSLNKSLNTAKPASLSTIRKPQLTNYALNEANLGVQMGMNPSIFSDNDI